MGHEQIVRSEPERGTGILQADLILGVYEGKFETVANENDNIVIGVNLPIAPMQSLDPGIGFSEPR